jgi:hypothetical protein
VASDERKWVVEPEDARIEVAIGEQAQLSPELREALEHLAQIIERGQEVEGYFQCNEVHFGPCYSYFSCKGVYS